MTDECRIDVRNQGAAIELEVSAKQFANPKVCPRPALNVTPAEFDQLRAGKATSGFVDDVRDRISKWLQDPDLDLPTILGLGVAEECRSRIVFNVSSIRDEKLRYELADFPIEMATPKGDVTALSLQHRVSSIVHQLPKVGRPPASAATGWPFKVLIVRAGPTDLPPVPAAEPIAAEIRALVPGAANLQIDVLSTEPGGAFAGAPTREKLREQLSQGYHILVFLGHGNVQEIPGVSIPTGQLQLENPQRLSDPFEARRVATLLHELPVPVVLLVGCLTAADLTAEELELFEAELPKWLRGSQGVAQALINSTSGVQCAVGMRYRVDGADATLFIRDFFRSLLVPSADNKALGNVEAAVKTARHALNALGRQALSWAAPVVFRTLGAEPMFPFLASPPTPLRIEIDNEEQAARMEVWEALARVNWSQRKPGGGGLYDRVQVMLRRLEGDVFDEVRARAALIMPARQELDPGLFQAAPAATRVDVPILLHKAISVRRLKGTIVEGTQNALITKVTLSPAVAAAGFELMLGPLDSNVLKFEIGHPAGNVGNLPEGQLLNLQLAIGSAIEAVYQLGIEALQSEPPVPLCGAANAVIVPAP
jgi:CHAT domain